MLAFYVPTDEHGFLSNFSPHGFELDQRYWPTVEHYFQAQKFAGTEHEERIRTARTPKAAKDLGQTRKIALREDWEDVKIDVMRAAVQAKFQTHEDLRIELLLTGNQKLVENSPTDAFWGCGSLGNGQNMLGQILMDTRVTFQQAALPYPRVYADFNKGTNDDAGNDYLLLVCYGTVRDMCQQQITLERGMLLTVYMDSDVNEDIECDVVADYDANAGRWVAKLDFDNIRFVEVDHQQEAKDFPCIECRLDLRPHIDKHGRNNESTCPQCGTLMNQPLAPPRS